MIPSEFFICLLLYNIVHPHILFDEYGADHAFDPVRNLYENEDPKNIDPRKPAEDPRDRNRDNPHVYAVEQKCNYCFAAGSQSKVGCMQQSNLRRKNCLRHQ